MRLLFFCKKEQSQKVAYAIKNTNYNMKIYTRKGDKGTTSLVGGTRVSKSDLRLEAYGTIDELMAHVGYYFDVYDSDNEHIIEIMDRLMTCSSLLASQDITLAKLPQIAQSDVDDLERWTDELLLELPDLTYFTLPAGSPALSYTHICRTVCRRAERAIIRCNEHQGEVPELVMAYVNRLSDYFYALGRFMGKKTSAREILWKPRK